MKNTKRVISLILTTLMLMSLFTMTVSANNEIRVFVDGKQLQFDVPPQTVNYRTMVPVRAIFEALGARVDWYEDTQTIIATGTDGKIVSLTLNSNTMYVHGTPVTLDAPAYETGGRTLVPVRAISEAFGSKVDWYEDTQTVAITSSTQSTTTPVLQTSTYTKSFNELYNLIVAKGQYMSNGVYVYNPGYSEVEVSFFANNAEGEKYMFITNGGDEIKINLFIEEEGSRIGHPWVTMEYNDAKIFEADYEKENVEVQVGKLDEKINEGLNITYTLFDAIINSLGCNVKMSDFGIPYTSTNSESNTTNTQTSKYLTSFLEIKNMLFNKGTQLSSGDYARSKSFEDGNTVFMSWDREEDYLGLSIFSDDDTTSTSIFIEEDENEAVGVIIAIGDSRFMADYNSGSMRIIKNDFGTSKVNTAKEVIATACRLFDSVLSGWDCDVKISDFGVSY